MSDTATPQDFVLPPFPKELETFFSTDEVRIIKELMLVQELSAHAVLRLALAGYQLRCNAVKSGFDIKYVNKEGKLWPLIHHNKGDDL